MTVLLRNNFNQQRKFDLKVIIDGYDLIYEFNKEVKLRRNREGLVLNKTPDV